MAETSKGKKFVKVKPYTRVVDGKKVRVGAFDRRRPEPQKEKRSRLRSARCNVAFLDLIRSRIGEREAFDGTGVHLIGQPEEERRFCENRETPFARL